MRRPFAGRAQRITVGDGSNDGAPPRRFDWRPLRRVLAVSLPVALAGVLLFGLVHALLIVPIWGRLLGGMPFALVAAAFLTWAYAELQTSDRLPRRGRGLSFGLLVWLSLFPVTALEAWLRLSGLRRQLGSLQLPLALLGAAATGVALGWWLTRRPRASLVWGACCAVVVTAMAGPIAVSNGRTHVLLFLAFLPIYLAAGVLIAALLRRARSTPPAIESRPWPD
jgi:hypothetical protein